MRGFNTKEDAEEWMINEVDDPCVDGERFAFSDDKEAIRAYEIVKDNGCCGFFDEEITVNGRKAMIGCNYGH
jgi:hypothetical protein